MADKLYIYPWLEQMREETMEERERADTCARLRSDYYSNHHSILL
jgi:hypothetical protein